MKAEVAKDLIELVNGMKDFIKSKQVKYGNTTFDYVPLDDILDKVKKYEKWAVLQPLSNENGLPCVETILVHESGDAVYSGKLLLITNGTKMQDFGSVITYTRRYQIGAFLGINTELDNDATDQKPVETKATKGQVELLTKLYTGDKLNNLLEHYQITSIEQMSLLQASELIKKIEDAKKAKQEAK